MAKLWSLLRGNKDTERSGGLSIDDYAKLLQMNNNSMGLMSRGVGQTSEQADEEFQTYVYQAYKSNGIVFAAMLTRSLVFSEARFQYQHLKNGRPTDLWGTDDLAILETPWPNGTTGELLTRAIQDVDLAGNHYMLRESKGRLRRLRPDWVRILLTAAPDEAVKSDVAGYLYMPGGEGSDPSKWEVYPVDGSNGVVAHWSPIPDPDAQYKGMSWLTPVLREVMSDKQATAHKAKYFQNGAVPNLVFSFKETVTTEQFKEFVEIMNSTKGGVEHAYENLYVAGGADVTAVGADMRMMDFRSVIGAGEVRIAAAARVHPVILGLSDALTGSSLNSGNYSAAKRQFGDGTMRPLWRSLCAAYAPLVAKKSGSRLWYDDRDIEFLRTDRKEAADIIRIQSQTISSFVMAGYEPDSIVEAIQKEDLGLLTHTGLYSVQLLPPGTVGKALEPGAPGATPATQDKPAKSAPAAAPTKKPTPATMPKKKPTPPGTQ